MAYDKGLDRTLQIAEIIKRYIKDSSLQPGDKLPTIAYFASTYSIGKNLINDAMSILSYDGTVVIKPRHGIFIAGTGWQNLYPMMPDWHNLTTKSPQEMNSIPFARLSRKLEETPKRIISNPLVNSAFFPDIVKNGLNGAVKLSARKDIDIWFQNGLPLRKKLCEYMKGYGLDVSADHVFILAGVVDALTAVCVTTMHPGMEVLYGTPSWVPPKKRLMSYGIKMTGIEMDREGIAKDGLLKHLKSSPQKMVYVAPSFSNPSGIVTSLERREEILRICSNTKTPIIEVDSYRELSNELPPPIAALDNSGSVIYVGSIREMFPVGYHLSWVVAPKAIVERFYHYKIQTDFTSRLTELFFYSILESGDIYAYRDFFQKFIKKRRDFTERVLTQYLGDVATWDSNGHPIIYWLKLRNDIDMEKIYASDDLLLYRGTEYEAGYDHYLTVSSMNMSQHSFIKAIKCLSEVIHK